MRNYTITLTSKQIDIMLELLEQELQRESEKLENKIAPEKIIKTSYGTKYDFTGLDTANYELLFDLINLLQSKC